STLDGCACLSICRNFSRVPSNGAGFCRRGDDMDGLCRACPRCAGRQRSLSCCYGYHFIDCSDDCFPGSDRLILSILFAMVTGTIFLLIILDKPLILLDEPTSILDPTSKEKVTNLLFWEFQPNYSFHLSRPVVD